MGARAHGLDGFLRALRRAGQHGGGDDLLDTIPPGPEAADTFTYDPADTTRYLVNAREPGLSLNEDYAEVNAVCRDMLVYTTGPLECAMEITGPGPFSDPRESDLRDVGPGAGHDSLMSVSTRRPRIRSTRQRIGAGGREDRCGLRNDGCMPEPVGVHRPDLHQDNRIKEDIMKRIGAVAIAILMAACTESPSAPSSEDTSLAAFSATTEVVNVVEPFQLGVYVDCAAGGTGEVVQLEGTLHTLVTWIVDEQGGIHARFQSQPQQVSGYGLTTGLRYQGTGVTQDTGSMQGSGLPMEYTFINNYRIIGQGPGNNLIVHIAWHYTINANGEVTAGAESSTSECK